MNDDIKTRPMMRYKIALRGAVVVLLFLGLAVMSLRIYAGSAVRQSEVLTQRIFTLKPSRSKLTDVRAIMPKDARFSGKCDEQECYALATIATTALIRGPVDNAFFRSLGIRPAKYQATVDVRGGLVTRFAFLVLYRATDGTWFSGSTSVLDDFSDADRCKNASLSRHPNYVLLVNQQQPHARIVRSGVTVQASPDEYARAQTLNLDCAISLHNCSLFDLMPFAYRDFIKDSEWEGSNRGRVLAEETSCRQNQSASSTRPIPWWTTGWQSAEN